MLGRFGADIYLSENGTEVEIIDGPDTFILTFLTFTCLFHDISYSATTYSGQEFVRIMCDFRISS